jgi:hypothetical protein
LIHLSRQCLEKREKSILATEVHAWAEDRNNKKVIANWQFKTADARIKLKPLYPSILS